MPSPHKLTEAHTSPSPSHPRSNTADLRSPRQSAIPEATPSGIDRTESCCFLPRQTFLSAQSCPSKQRSDTVYRHRIQKTSSACRTSLPFLCNLLAEVLQRFHIINFGHLVMCFVSMLILSQWKFQPSSLLTMKRKGLSLP